MEFENINTFMDGHRNNKNKYKSNRVGYRTNKDRNKSKKKIALFLIPVSDFKVAKSRLRPFFNQTQIEKFLLDSITSLLIEIILGNTASNFDATIIEDSKEPFLSRKDPTLATNSSCNGNYHKIHIIYDQIKSRKDRLKPIPLIITSFDNIEKIINAIILRLGKYNQKLAFFVINNILFLDESKCFQNDIDKASFQWRLNKIIFNILLKFEFLKRSQRKYKKHLINYNKYLNRRPNNHIEQESLDSNQFESLNCIVKVRWQIQENLNVQNLQHVSFNYTYNSWENIIAEDCHSIYHQNNEWNRMEELIIMPADMPLLNRDLLNLILYPEVINNTRVKLKLKKKGRRFLGKNKSEVIFFESHDNGISIVVLRNLRRIFRKITEIKGMKGIKGVKEIREVKGIKGVKEIREVKGIKGVKEIKGIREIPQFIRGSNAPPNIELKNSFKIPQIIRYYGVKNSFKKTKESINTTGLNAEFYSYLELSKILDNYNPFIDIDSKKDIITLRRHLLQINNNNKKGGDEDKNKINGEEDKTMFLKCFNPIQMELLDFLFRMLP
ncbi:MAG: hypothetical protein ACTSU2_04785 [Promethearchaeota archaeon]